jgi:hypothetical protein
MWSVATTGEFDRWLDGLGHETVAEVIAVVSLLRQYGPQLARPHADTLKGSRFANMKELRVRTAAAQIRPAFAFDPDRQAVLLVAGDKRGVNQKRFYRRLIAEADALYAAHLRTAHPRKR